MFNILRCSVCCRPSRMWITFNRFLTIFEAFVPHFHLRCTHCIVPKSFWIIPIVSVEECSSFRQNLMQVHCYIRSVILKAVATQYTCSLNGIYCPHWLVQWSHHCSHMRIQVHSPWLPGYTDVAHTILIILTRIGLFLDRPHISGQLLFFLLDSFNIFVLYLILSVEGESFKAGTCLYSFLCLTELACKNQYMHFVLNYIKTNPHK